MLKCDTRKCLVGTFKVWGLVQEFFLLSFNVITVQDHYLGMKNVKALDGEGPLIIKKDN